MSYETKTYVVTKTVNVRKFPDSSSGSLVSTLSKGTIVEADSSGTYINTRGGSTTTYLPVVVDGTRRWAVASNLAEATPLDLAAGYLEEVYNSCIGCKHVSGSYTWATAMSKKQVNCSIPVSRLATLSGILPDGKRICHTDAVKSNILTTKATIAKSMNGYSDLDLDKCTVKYVGAKNYAALDAKYKKKGYIYVQDSNIAVCGGDGSIYACHEWAEQMTAGKGTYTKVKLTSGYTQNSPVLVVIMPNG